MTEEEKIIPEAINILMDDLISTKVISVEKQSSAESGYIATYVIKQGGTQVGSKINIPKDYLVKSASMKTCETANKPVSGYKVGDKYLDFVINTKDSSGTDEHIYILVSDLIDTYTADNSTLELSNNQFKIKDKGVTFAKLNTGAYDTTTGGSNSSSKLITSKAVYDGLTGKVNTNDTRLTDVRVPKFTSIGGTKDNPIDLNDYRSGGFYYCSNNDASKYIVHCPSSMVNISDLPEDGVTANKSFFLLVETWGQSNANYVKQTLTYYNTNKTYVRIRVASSTTPWGSWEELSKVGHNHDDTYIKTGTGTVTSNNIATGAVTNDKINDGVIDFAKLKPKTVSEGTDFDEIKEVGLHSLKSTVTVTNRPYFLNYLSCTILNFKYTNGTNDLHQIVYGINQQTENNKIYYRVWSVNGWKGWREVFFMDDADSSISSSSTKPVQNKAVYTALTGKVNTSQGSSNADKTLSTDANGNVIVEAKNNHTHSYLPLSGGTLTGNVTSSKNITTTGTIEGATIKKTNGTSAQFLKADGSVDSNSYIVNGTGTVTSTNILDKTIVGGDIADSTIDFTKLKPKTVSAGTDFDEIKEVGLHSLAKTTTITNRPSFLNSLSCTILNFKYNVSNTDLHQLVYGISGTTKSNKIYYRVWSVDGWKGWREVAFRDDINNEYIESTQTSSTNAWTGTSTNLSSLTAGTMIFYHLKKASNGSNVTLDLTLNDGTSTGAKNVITGHGSVTTEFSSWSVICMVYDGSNWVVVNNEVVIDSLESNSTINPLSANQGRILNDEVNTKVERGSSGSIDANQNGFSGTIKWKYIDDWLILYLINVSVPSSATSYTKVNPATSRISATTTSSTDYHVLTYFNTDGTASLRVTSEGDISIKHTVGTVGNVYGSCMIYRPLD